MQPARGRFAELGELGPAEFTASGASFGPSRVRIRTSRTASEHQKLFLFVTICDCKKALSLAIFSLADLAVYFRPGWKYIPPLGLTWAAAHQCPSMPRIKFQTGKE